jgi:hypothetical protein
MSDKEREQKWHRPNVTPLYFPKDGIKRTEDRFNWIQAVQRDCRLTPQTRLVLIRLVQFHNLKTERCDPTVRHLAMMAGLGDDESAPVMARRAVERGEELGWVRRRRRSGGGGLYNQSNSYELLVPADITPAGLAAGVKLHVVERDGKWFVAQAKDRVEICGPIDTREAAETWVKEHGPASLSEQSESLSELSEGFERTGEFVSNSEYYNSEDNRISFLSKGRSDERPRPGDSKSPGREAASSKNQSPVDRKNPSAGSKKLSAGHKQEPPPLPQEAAGPSPPPDIEALAETVRGGRTALAPLLYEGKPMTLGALIHSARLVDEELDVAGFLKCGAVYLENGLIYPAGCKRRPDGSYDPLYPPSKPLDDSELPF